MLERAILKGLGTMKSVFFMLSDAMRYALRAMRFLIEETCHP